MGEVQEKLDACFQLRFQQSHMKMPFILPVTMCDNTGALLPIREVLLSLCVQGFY